jgi:hypothetical protein
MKPTERTKPSLTVLLALLGLAVSTGGALATSTGLNNIPTADTPPDRTLVFQQYNTFGGGRKPDSSAGLKMGLRPFPEKYDWNHFEWGADFHLAPGQSGPVVFQGKYALQPWENLPTLGLGATNLAITGDDRDRVGQPYSFAVLTQDFRWLRATFGYGLQVKNDGGFFGLDKTVPLFRRDLMLRTDIIQIENERQWLGSVGFLYLLHKSWALESWVSQPTEHGQTSFTIKLNGILEF